MEDDKKRYTHCPDNEDIEPVKPRKIKGLFSKEIWKIVLICVLEKKFWRFL
jgi:hypothetical protein